MAFRYSKICSVHFPYNVLDLNCCMKHIRSNTVIPLQKEIGGRLYTLVSSYLMDWDAFHHPLRIC